VRLTPNLPLNSDPACIVLRSLSTSRFLGFAQRLGAGGAGYLPSLGILMSAPYKKIRQAISPLALLFLSLSIFTTWSGNLFYPKGAMYGLGPTEAEASLIRFKTPENWPVLQLKGTEGVLDAKVQPTIQVAVSHTFLNAPVQRAVKWPMIIILFTVLSYLLTFVLQWRQSRLPNP